VAVLRCDVRESLPKGAEAGIVVCVGSIEISLDLQANSRLLSSSALFMIS
jgi:hypothetical protein